MVLMLVMIVVMEGTCMKWKGRRRAAAPIGVEPTEPLSAIRTSGSNISRYSLIAACRYLVE